MEGLVLAAGEGSRLAAPGIDRPKPFVLVGGEPLVGRALRSLCDVGCAPLTALVRAEHADAARAVARATGARVIACRTPSSLHTLAIGLAAVMDEMASGRVLVTMVDTVMRARSFQRVRERAEAELDAGADAVLAVTPFIDDERPVHVALDDRGRVRSVGGEPAARPLVTGGVYAFGPRAAELVRTEVDAGASRVRAFLAAMVARGLEVRAVEIDRIVDVDRPEDLRLAASWIAEEEGARA
jgi:NDP-sugar pyrophosphorylase family protein